MRGLTVWFMSSVLPHLCVETHTAGHQQLKHPGFWSCCFFCMWHITIDHNYFSNGCCCTTWPDSWLDPFCFNLHWCYENHLSMKSLKTSLSCRNPPLSRVKRKSDVQQPVWLRRAGQFCDGSQTWELRRSRWLLFSIFFTWFKETGLSFACAVIL